MAIQSAIRFISQILRSTDISTCLGNAFLEFGVSCGPVGGRACLMDIDFVVALVVSDSLHSNQNRILGRTSSVQNRGFAFAIVAP